MELLREFVTISDKGGQTPPLRCLFRKNKSSVKRFLQMIFLINTIFLI